LVFFIGLMTLTYAAAGWFTRDPEAVAVFNNFGPVTQSSDNLQQWPGFASFLARREAIVALLAGFIAIPLIASLCGAVGGVWAAGAGNRPRANACRRGAITRTTNNARRSSTSIPNGRSLPGTTRPTPVGRGRGGSAASAG
jgi:hypothetical protein